MSDLQQNPAFHKQAFHQWYNPHRDKNVFTRIQFNILSIIASGYANLIIKPIVLVLWIRVNDDGNDW